MQHTYDPILTGAIFALASDSIGITLMPSFVNMCQRTRTVR